MSIYSRNLLVDSSTLIASNELILEIIFNYLDEQGIEKCNQVCRQWALVANSIDKSKRKVLQIFTVFLMDRYSSIFFHSFDKFHCKSRTIQKSVQQYHSLESTSFKGPELFEHSFLTNLSKLYSSPRLLILLEGSNTKIGKKRRWKRAKVINAIRSNLPHDCAVIGVDAHYGIIGESSDLRSKNTKDPLTIAYDVCGLFAISSILLPKYNGVNIEIFERSNDEFEEVFYIPQDIKAVILFSSGVSNKGDYLSHPQVDAILRQLKGNLALGGAQVNDKLITTQPTVRYYSDDTANFFFINGLPPYNSMFNPKKMSLIGIQFSGPNCDAASIAINRLTASSTIVDCLNMDESGKELAHIESKLASFKNNLPFNCDSPDPSNESIAFLFFNYDCYKNYVNCCNDINAGISIFYSYFPKTRITGILCHAQYNFNYIPGNEKKDKTNQEKENYDDMSVEDDIFNSNLLPSRQTIASFVIINIKK